MARGRRSSLSHLRDPSIPASASALPKILDAHEQAIVAEWVAAQGEEGGLTRRGSMLPDAQRRQQSEELLGAIRAAMHAGGTAKVQGPEWATVRDILAGISRSRAQLGFSPAEVARFVLALKRPVFERLLQDFTGDARALASETWSATELFDNLALWTTEVFETARDDVIARQQQDLLELSTPVITLWKGVLALPMIGTLDSARTQVVMESLLGSIVQNGADIAIIDITGVPTVDTMTAQHLLKTVTATRLMGAECIISGIRPQIAQTIVHLGVDLAGVITKGSLADAFALALRRRGLTVVKS